MSSETDTQKPFLTAGQAKLAILAFADAKGDFCIIPSSVSALLQAFLDRFAATLRNGVHAALMLDGAG